MPTGDDDKRQAFRDAVDLIRVNLDELATGDPVTYPVHIQQTVNAIEAALWKVRQTVGTGTR